METIQWIPVSLFCESHQVEISFIDELEQFGLIQLKVEQSNRLIAADHLPEVEKMLLLHEEMGINYEGIETVMHLLGKIQGMQAEMSQLRRQLRSFAP
ncbi:MAG TPA: chaperone modulator CbpM [Flavihumibacter sp.]|nr:chaperone modulator CbpM [Bacteroidota bacterium]HQD10729.1 chaperone modulator CbpM [Flavihumibacter sp.]